MTSLPLRLSHPRTDENSFSLSGRLRRRLQRSDSDFSSPPSSPDSTAAQLGDSVPSLGGLSSIDFEEIPPSLLEFTRTPPPLLVYRDNGPPYLAAACLDSARRRQRGSPINVYDLFKPKTSRDWFSLDFAMGDSSTNTSAFGSGELGHLGVATGRVKRVTMFKIPDLANQQLLVDAYKVLEEKQSKDANGKSYILSIDAGIVKDPARAQGHTVIGTTEFNSLEDMRFYDEECQDHSALKARARELGLEEPPLVAYWFVRVDPGEEVAV